MPEEETETVIGNYRFVIKHKMPSSCLKYWDGTCERVEQYFEDASVDIHDGFCEICENRHEIARSTFYRYF